MDSLVGIIVLANTLHLRVFSLLQIHLYQHSLQPVQICVGFISLESVCSVLKLSQLRLGFVGESLKAGIGKTPFPCHFVDSSHSSKSRTCKRELSLLAGSLSLSLSRSRPCIPSFFSHVMDSVGLMRFDILVLFLLQTLFSPSFGPAQPTMLYLKIHFLYFNCMKNLSVIFVPPSLVNSCSNFQFVLSSVSCLSA
jgi:hypothetical protein